MINRNIFHNKNVQQRLKRKLVSALRLWTHFVAGNTNVHCALLKQVYWVRISHVLCYIRPFW